MERIYKNTDQKFRNSEVEVTGMQGKGVESVIVQYSKSGVGA